MEEKGRQAGGGASTSSLESFFDPPQPLSVSLNVQVDLTAKYASFAAYSEGDQSRGSVRAIK